jgi:dephospho-CoA kinase
MIVGITGNIGSGKSTLGKFIELQGFEVIDADVIGKTLLLKGEKGYKLVVEKFGEKILKENLEIDTGKLGSLVFSSGEKLKLLTSIIHPLIKSELLKIKERNRNSVVFVEAAVLIEAKWEKLFDRIITVFAYKGQRILRAAKRFGIKEAIRREKFQLSYKEKLKFTDYLVCNTKRPIDMFNQAEKILEEISKYG